MVTFAEIELTHISLCQPILLFFSEILGMVAWQEGKEYSIIDNLLCSTLSFCFYQHSQS